jgi:hypothetical protein
VRKSFNIADISVFEGELASRDQGRELSRRRVKLSCSSDTIEFPEGISRILLKRVIMLTEGEGLFISDDIIKLAEKKMPKK